MSETVGNVIALEPILTGVGYRAIGYVTANDARHDTCLVFKRVREIFNLQSNDKLNRQVNNGWQ
jgi:hypothetical protein